MKKAADMSLIEKLPKLDDTDLGILLANARRLAVSGQPRQRTDAADLLPKIEAEIAARKAAAPAKKPAKPRRKAKSAEEAAAAPDN